MALIRRGLVMFDYLARLGAKDTYKAKFEALCAAVDNAPAVDAEPVRHAKWTIEGHDAYTQYIRCSGCRKLFTNIPWKSFEFCPNCGAKMDGDEKNV